MGLTRAFPMRVLQAAMVLAGLCALGRARAEGVDCELGFSLANWLERSQSGSGVGTLHCSDNDTMVVRIRIKGAGIAAGTHSIYSGHARFSRVRRIHDLLGTYASEHVPAGDAEAPHAQFLAKGDVLLTLSGKEGWDRGVTFGTIELLARPLKSWRK